MALTTRQVAKLTEPGRYGDGRGLYLQVTPTGARSWLLRYERGGRERAMGLGPVEDFTLDQARERARKARQLLKDGIDPIDARNEERAARPRSAPWLRPRTSPLANAQSNILSFTHANGIMPSTPRNFFRR
jgi:hypothetical protein